MKSQRGRLLSLFTGAGANADGAREAEAAGDGALPDGAGPGVLHGSRPGAAASGSAAAAAGTGGGAGAILRRPGVSAAGGEMPGSAVQRKTAVHFQPIEVVSRYRDPQPQVVEN